MATHHAIAGACEAIVRLLRASYDPDQFNGATLDFQVYVSENFQHPMTEGVSVLLYRVYHNAANRTPPGRVVGGERRRPKLPLDVHLLLTAWAKTACRQHEIAGWMMRVLEDHPILPPAILNAYRSDVFQPDETVEVVLGDLGTEEMFRIWEVMIQHVYQLSVPYVARVVNIESTLSQLVAPGVRERELGLQVLGWAGADR